MSPAEAVLGKMKATTPSATPTPTPSPTKVPQQTVATTTKKPVRRAIRTYGKKRTLPDETHETQSSKRTKTSTATAAMTITQPGPTRRDSIADEVSRQLQKEAAEAECRNNKRPQTPTKANPKAIPFKATPPRKAPSPRRVGIMRYFQPAARSAPPPPPSLPEPCSPALSISSMSSLSSCPSPTSSIGSFRSRASSVVSSPSANSSYSLDETAFTMDEPDSPPASPLWQGFEQRPRQKRRLTIRPDQQVKTTTEDDTTKDCDEKNVAQEVDEETKENIPVAPSFGSSVMAASSTRMRLRLGLSSTTTPSATTKKRKKTSGPPSVQTTLSLAVAPRNGGSSDSASVRECKECNILYNPLHEKDAKFHARYHASVCRKQQKEGKEQNIQDREQSAATAAAAGVRLR
ncbi:hypothetical protein Sste5346_004431 [Sporothrix stenoceras]|uniref:N-acetyltransferase ESCO zinc-finger domain-containing protein n=1 Tax=Sporothrix stenoceras TaxID=5173 RepID=A0ABR3Z812_9PEZI